MRGRGAPRDNCLTHDERILFLDILRRSVHFSEQDIEKASNDIEAGSDGPLKFLLFALCPRLTTVKYSRDYRASGRQAFDREDDPRSTPRSSLDYHQRAITLHSDFETWPAGLQSICKLEVGVETGYAIDMLTCAAPVHLVLDIIKLPNLVSLYWHGLSNHVGNETLDRDTSDVSASCGVISGTRSVRHIFIDGSILHSRSLRDPILSAPRALKSITVSNNLERDISRWFNGGCDTVMVYRTDDERGGYECNLHRPDESLTISPRILFIDPIAFFLDEFSAGDRDRHGSCEYRTPDHPRRRHRQWTEPLHFFADRIKQGLLPPSVETIVLDRLFSGLNEVEADLVDDAVVAMIAARSTHLAHLKAIYMAALEDEPSRGYDGFQGVQPRTRRWFKNAIRAGRNAGIDVHTSTTRGKCFHEKDFPKPPNRADLKFVPDDEGPLEFDVYSGEWGPPSCGNCGGCSVCLHRYAAEVWQEVDQAYMA